MTFDNEMYCWYFTESELLMKINRCIVSSNGARVHVRANSEQEYAERLWQMTQVPIATLSKKILFGEYAERWFASRHTSKKSCSQCNERLHLDACFLPAFGDMSIDCITKEMLLRLFHEMLESGTASSTMRRRWTTLHLIAEEADEDGISQEFRRATECSAIKKCIQNGKKSKITVPYTPEQMRYMVEHLTDVKKPYDRAWLTLMTLYPFRPEEVLGLKWEDIDAECCVVRIRNTVIHPSRNDGVFSNKTKTESSQRAFHMVPEVFDQVMHLLPERGDPNDFVIGGEAPLTYQQVVRMRERIANDIGFEGKITPRRFRTTVASDLYAKTHDVKLVQEQLGHSTPKMTMEIYVKGRQSGAPVVSLYSPNLLPQKTPTESP